MTDDNDKPERNFTKCGGCGLEMSPSAIAIHKCKPERPQCPICGRKISTPETCECSDNKYWVEQGKRLANDEPAQAEAPREWMLIDVGKEFEVSGPRPNPEYGENIPVIEKGAFARVCCERAEAIASANIHHASVTTLQRELDEARAELKNCGVEIDRYMKERDSYRERLQKLCDKVTEQALAGNIMYYHQSLSDMVEQVSNAIRDARTKLTDRLPEMKQVLNDPDECLTLDKFRWCVEEIERMRK